MVVFDYKCEKCGTVFEELVKDPDKTPECPKCGSENVKRQPGLFGTRGAPGQMRTMPKFFGGG